MEEVKDKESQKTNRKKEIAETKKLLAEALKILSDVELQEVDIALKKKSLSSPSFFNDTLPKLAKIEVVLAVMTAKKDDLHALYSDDELIDFKAKMKILIADL